MLIMHLFPLCTENQQGLLKSIGQEGIFGSTWFILLLKGSRLSSATLHVSRDFVWVGFKVLQGTDFFLVTSPYRFALRYHAR